MKFKLKKKHASILASIIVLVLWGVQYFSVTPPAAPGGAGTYAIDHFIDGDTIAVKMSNTVEFVRFIGVDTPETHKPNSPVQCYGVAASAFTKQQIGTQRVRLEADSQNTNRDRYNRLLRYVYLPDGTLLNEKLVSLGYGFAYTQFPFSKKALFTRYQSDAKQNNKGLWGNCAPYQQSNERWQTQDLTS